jgi:hypothetical protein
MTMCGYTTTSRSGNTGIGADEFDVSASGVSVLTRVPIGVQAAAYDDSQTNYEYRL